MFFLVQNHYYTFIVGPLVERRICSVYSLPHEKQA